MNISIKSTYFLLGAAMVLAGCSQDDAPARVDQQGERIIFRTSLPELSSRSEVIDNDNLPYFQVTAFDPVDNDKVVGGKLIPNFENKPVEVTGSLGFYTSQECLWPAMSKEDDVLSFFTFYPSPDKLGSDAQLVNNSTPTALDYKLKDICIMPDISAQVDFITAYATGSMSDNLYSGVNLTFAHQLSRIEIEAWSKNKTCDIEIAGIRIGGAGVKGTFAFDSSETGGAWQDATVERGIVEYVFRSGDMIVTLPNGRMGAPTNSSDGAVTIMGSQIDNHNNCAMLIPSTYAEWNASGDGHNAGNNLYFSVLLRITDVPPNAGINPKEKQRYPYRDLSQGENALEIPKEYFAVETSTGKILERLDQNGKIYGTTTGYDLPAGAEIREFGWAALPVSGTWQPGKIYTYTLDYTSGIGLHDPEVTTGSPAAGNAVISDKVAVTYTVKDWLPGGGAELPVPGS